MPVNTDFQIPFSPQTGLTQQILAAIQLANEHHVQNQQLAIQQQQANTQQGQLQVAQQKAPSEIDESKARTGLYGTQQQQAQQQIDITRQGMNMFMGGGQGQPPQPSQQTAPTAQATPQQQPAGPQQLPQGVPPAMAPIVQGMMPSNMNPEETSRMQAATLAPPKDLNPMSYLQQVKDAADQIHSNRAVVAREPQNQPPQPKDIDNFNKNFLNSLVNLTPDQTKAFTAAAANAKTNGELQRVQDQATVEDGKQLTQKINEKNIVANRDIVFSQGQQREGINKILTDNQNYGKTITQANIGLKDVDNAKNGDDLAVRMIPTMEVLGINLAANLSRINPQEAIAAGVPVQYSNKFAAFWQAHIDGKLNPQQVTEGKQLMHDIVDAKYQDYLNQTQLVVQNTFQGDPTANDRVYIVKKDGSGGQKLSEALKGAPSTPSATGSAPGGWGAQFGGVAMPSAPPQ